MIELTTGLPGNGKTLYTIKRIKDRAEKENRAVFYHGIPELKLNWQKLEDPTKWMDCPPGSIVVMDEAQQTFRNRSISSTPPAHVTALETHRHLGVDLVMITQHPRLIDPAVRVLVNRHDHLIRIHGFEASSVHKWDAVQDNCDKPAGRKNSESTKWVFDKTIYGLYKSAEEHTHKAKIPTKAKVLMAIPFVILLAIVGAWFALRALREPDVKPKPAAAAPANVSSPAAANRPAGDTAGRTGRSRPDPIEDAQDYVWKETPRVVGLPYTAPKYDAITTPVRAPYPAMCISKQSHDGKQITCKCYSQQATPLNVDFNMCIQISRDGFFRDFDPERGGQQVARADASQRVLDRVPDAPLPDHSAPGGAVVVIPGQTMGAARSATGAMSSTDSVIQNGPPNNRATRAAAAGA